MIKKLNGLNPFDLLEVKTKDVEKIKKELQDLMAFDLFMDLMLSYNVDEPLKMSRHDFINLISDKSRNFADFDIRKKNVLENKKILNYDMMACIYLGKEKLLYPVLEVLFDTPQGNLVKYHSTGCVETDELIEETLMKEYEEVEGLDKEEYSVTLYNCLNPKHGRNIYDSTIADIVNADKYGKIMSEIKDMVEHSYLSEEELKDRKLQKIALSKLRSDPVVYREVMRKTQEEWERIIESNKKMSIMDVIMEVTK